GDGNSPSYQGTPEGAKSPVPFSQEQGLSELHPTEVRTLEPAGLELKARPVPLPEVALDAVSFMLPLVWPEESLDTSSLLESLQNSQPDSTAEAGTSVTPGPTAEAGTSVTSLDLRDGSVNASVSVLPCSKDSTAQTDFLLWHCPQEQLKSLPRSELEGWLESASIIIEALAFRLHTWQESRGLLSSVGPAEQRDTFTQTDATHPKEVEEEIYHNLYLKLQRKVKVLQQQQGAEQDLLQKLELAAAGMSSWSRQHLLFQDFVDAWLQRLQDEQGALAQEREQVKALVSQFQYVLERVPGKLQSCLEERDTLRQEVDE
ncbi:SPAG5 protein, partial [Bucco capensis]|nr:SPAG5 protein [Bucco capensis]